MNSTTTTTEASKQYVPLTCHGHSRPVTHLSYSGVVGSSGAESSSYLISACKDNNPMLRDGITGDWIGTFFGHKGAVWQARLSADASSAATASADFSAKVWDTHTGEERVTLKHDHIVRAVAFPPNSSNIVATGGHEKKLRIFDLDKIDSIEKVDGLTVIKADAAFEIGAGVHKGMIRAIVWTNQADILITAADDKVIRWWDLGRGEVIQEYVVDGNILSCELTNVKGTADGFGGTEPILTVAAGRTVYFFGGKLAMDHLKSIKLDYEIASVALHPTQRKFVTGALGDTWARVHDLDSEQEITVHKGHHGPIWSISYSPDGKLYATGSEDGTIKMWKNCDGPFGLWGAYGTR
ncbi:WD40-repeat-containing domain protein [Bisporella sp. PMI_857]|nr:WD40-repeat-containing domain protein [Bisporella sp. PMI_857]